MTAPLTRAERTDYAETSRHADVMAFIAALAARGDRRLHVGSFGVSPEGRELPLLVLSNRRQREMVEQSRKREERFLAVLEGRVDTHHEPITNPGQIP